MERLDPSKLNVTYSTGADPAVLRLPRRYTLTHSDMTGALYLTIGNEHNRKQVAGLYTRLMRDEVLAELSGDADAYRLTVYCHVSGGFVIGTAGWRSTIFHRELPLVLEAIRYGDRTLFEQNPVLDTAEVFIRFQSSHKKYHRVEEWGVIGDYR